jgi:hypothetical protein
MAPESEQDLLDALARGEAQAIGALYVRHGARMIAFAPVAGAAAACA